MKKYQMIPLLLLFAFLNPGYDKAIGKDGKRTPKEYVDSYHDDAVKEMHQYGVPASITLAQGMLESDNGNSDLALIANNHFGIKCHEDWTGPTYFKDDDAKNECFRKYNSVLESYADHSLFLRSRQRYAFLFSLKTTDYKGWASGLKASGYATDPRYTERLLYIIERNHLNEFDKDVNLPPLPVTRDKNQNSIVRKNLPPRETGMVRDRPFVIARDGDSFASLTREYQKGAWELPRYNELDRNTALHAGQRIYLQPKRRKGSADYHVVKSGETMYSISQEYCMKLRFLYRDNNMEPGTQPKAGDVLFLRKRKKLGLDKSGDKNHPELFSKK